MARALSMPSGPLPEYLRLPRVAPGTRIGLYGGSFNPAHSGHRDTSLFALKRLRLDRIWWLVSPGNPLKNLSGLPSAETRVVHARQVAASNFIDVSAFEEALGTRYSLDTLAFLKQRFPSVRFVWLMGGDNLATFHLWRGWRELARMMPIAVVDRPGWTLKAQQGKAAATMKEFRRPEKSAGILADMKPPAWIYLHGPRNFLSSTALRERGENATNSGNPSL